MDPGNLLVNMVAIFCLKWQRRWISFSDKRKEKVYFSIHRCFLFHPVIPSTSNPPASNESSSPAFVGVG